MQFRTPAGLDTAQFKSNIAWLKSQGKGVMISLGGGGQHFTLADPRRVPAFVASVAQIVSDYGFNVEGDQKQFFEPLPAYKVAVGFLTGDTTPAIVSQAMDYLITGKAPAGVTYKLRQRSGYPAMLGGMFWTIDADRRGNYSFSNVVGPQLHAYPSGR